MSPLTRADSPLGFTRFAKAFVPIDGTIAILQKNAKHFPSLKLN
jgi:hypothetical protein